jgi:hypothetical protein
MMIFPILLSGQGTEITIDHDNLHFDVGQFEFAKLTYDYQPFGPTLQLHASHYLSTLRLNSTFRIDFRTGGNNYSDVQIDNYGYTRLGVDGPSIKMKTLYGTSSSTTSGSVRIDHGLGDADRILGVQVHMNQSIVGDVFYPPGFTSSSNRRFEYYWDSSAIVVANAAPSGSTLVTSKPIRILIFYER